MSVRRPIVRDDALHLRGLRSIRMQMLRWFAVILWLAPRPAAATSYFKYAYERMDLRLLEVREGGRLVDPPPGLPNFDELGNHGSLRHGNRLILWDPKHGPAGLRTDNPYVWRDAKSFEGREPGEPSEVQRAYIEILPRLRRPEWACLVGIPYTPILPGRYVADEGVWNDERSTAIEAKYLTVSSDRQRVRLECSAGGRAYEALYEVTCAQFPCDRRGFCGPKEPHDDTQPLLIPSPPDEEPRPVEPRGCDLAPGREPTLLVLIVALGWWRRARRRISRPLDQSA